MSTLAIVQGFKPEKAYKGEIGLEIETETKNAYTVPNEMYELWTTHPDGSLRDHGVEYIFGQPYDFHGENYNKALHAFKSMAKTVPFVHSTYSSVHVHFNMMHYDLKHIANFITLYFLLEELLGEYCGPDRNGNLFCLKTSCAEFNYTVACRLFGNFEKTLTVRYLNNLNPNSIKYSGLNLAPLKTLGSLEVRTHGGTTDVDLIDRWIGILYMIYRKARDFSNPLEIMEYYKKLHDKNHIVGLIFEEYAKYLPAKSFAKLSKNSVYYAASFAACVNDWKNLDKIEAPVRNEKFKIKPSFVEYEFSNFVPLTPDDSNQAQELNQLFTHFNTQIGANPFNTTEDQ